METGFWLPQARQAAATVRKAGAGQGDEWVHVCVATVRGEAVQAGMKQHEAAWGSLATTAITSSEIGSR